MESMKVSWKKNLKSFEKDGDFNSVLKKLAISGDDSEN